MLDNYNIARAYADNTLKKIFEENNKKIDALKDRAKNALINYYSSKINEINKKRV